MKQILLIFEIMKNYRTKYIFIETVCSTFKNNKNYNKTHFKSN